MKRIFDWIGQVKKDKILHFVCGMIISQIMFTIFQTAFVAWLSVLLSLACTSVIGALKEVYDKHYGGCSETKDFIATTIGGVVGVALSILICII